MYVEPERLSILVLNFGYHLAFLQVSTRTLGDGVTKTLALISTDLSTMVPSFWRLVLLPRTISVALEVGRPCLLCLIHPLQTYFYFLFSWNLFLFIKNKNTHLNLRFQTKA